MAQKMLRGRGSLARVGELMEKLNVARPLLVCGDRLAAVFAERTRLSLPVYSGYHPNPDFADCAARAKKYREQG